MSCESSCSLLRAYSPASASAPTRQVSSMQTCCTDAKRGVSCSSALHQLSHAKISYDVLQAANCSHTTTLHTLPRLCSYGMSSCVEQVDAARLHQNTSQHTHSSFAAACDWWRLGTASAHMTGANGPKDHTTSTCRLCTLRQMRHTMERMQQGPAQATRIALPASAGCASCQSNRWAACTTRARQPAPA